MKQRFGTLILIILMALPATALKAQGAKATLDQVRSRIAGKDLEKAAKGLMSITTKEQLGAGESRTYLELFCSLEILLKDNLQGEAAKNLAVHSYRLFDQEPATMVHMAAVQMATGQTTDALNLLDQALGKKNSLYPLTVKERALMARIRGEGKALNGEMDAAERFFKRSLDMDPGSHTTRFQLGYLYFQTGKLEKARQAYEQAFTQGAAQATPADYLHLAALHLKNKNHLGCSTLLKKGVAQYPAEPNLRLNLGKALLAQEQVAEALFSFYGEMLLLPKSQMEPGSPGLTKIDRHIELTLKAAQGITNNNQKRMVLDFYEGVEALGRNKPATAVVSFNRVQTMGSERHLVVRYYLSQALALTGKEKEAMRLQDQLLKDHPTFPPLLASRADLAFLSGDSSTGVFFLTQAANISHDNWVVQETMERVAKYLETIDLDKVRR